MPFLKLLRSKLNININIIFWQLIQLLQEIYVGEIDAYKFIGIFSDGFDALSSMKNSVNPTIDAVPVTDKILHWTFVLAEKAAFAYEKHECN